MSADVVTRAAAILLLAPAACFADVFQSGEISLRSADEPATYEFVARLPGRSADIDRIEWPAGCRATNVRKQALGERMQVQFAVSCDRPLVRTDLIRTPWRLDAARLDTDLGGIPGSMTLTPSRGGLDIPVGAFAAGDRSWTQIAPGMLWQGMLHIWLGWDHLAFVLCLCMLCRGLRLLGLITAFTLGHSLSLGLSFFGILSIPIAPAEALIALSIVLVAREALQSTGPQVRSAPVSRAAVLVTIFGLVHGLGFASALGALGISTGERWPALIFFNLGVEIGQVLFVSALLALLAALRPRALAVGVRSASLYVAGIIGSFWLIERIAGFA